MHFCKAPHLVGTSALPALYFRWGLCDLAALWLPFFPSTLCRFCLSVSRFFVARKTWLIMQILISSGQVRLERLTSLTDQSHLTIQFPPPCALSVAPIVCTSYLRRSEGVALSMTLRAVCLIQLVKHTHCGPALLPGGYSAFATFCVLSVQFIDAFN